MTNDNQIEIDTGHTIISLTATDSKKGVIVTAYVNGMSCRCSNLHLPRVVDLFIDCVITACDYPDDGLQSDNITATEDTIFDYVTKAVNK